MSGRSTNLFLCGCRHFHSCLLAFLLFAGNCGLGRSSLISDQSIPIIQGRLELSPQRFKEVSLLSISSSKDDLSHEAGADEEPAGPSLQDSAGVDNSQLQGRTAKCEDVLQTFQKDFDVNKQKIVALLDGINQEKYLEKQSCLKSIVHPSAPFFLNPPEFSIVKYSVDLQFGAAWMWDKVARILLQNTEVPSIAKRFWAGVPPPVEVGDVVKVLEAGSTIVKRGEYTVVGVQGDECTVEKEGEKLNFPRDRLLLTIRKKYRYIADKVLTNELGNLNEEDPNLVADMEEVFELAGVREAFQQTLQTGDPRYLQTAMKNSETFHYAMRQLPGIKASPIQKPGKGGPKPDPAEMSSMYTSESAVKAYEVLQLIRGYTALEGCRPLTHKNLQGADSELVLRVIENAKFEYVEMQGEDTLQSVLENQCRSAAAFVFPRALKASDLVIPRCADVWERMRNDWSQLVMSSDIANDREALAKDCISKQGQLAPGYLSECDARCMGGVAKRNYWFDKKHIKRKAVGRDYILAGDVVRLSTFSAADTLPYLDLLGSQAWRLARIFSSTVTTRDVGEEVEELSCVADFLTKDGVDPVQGNHRMAGFRLPHLQLLALAVATDLRHHASIVGANLQSSKNMRKLAKKSRDFSAFFKLLSCHATDDTEALCKVFGPFASLAIRIALFLRVEVEEHANKGWTEVVGVFSGRVSERKLYDKAVQQVAANARKFIEKFMGGFGYEATGKIERVKKRIRNIFRRPRGKAPQNSGHHKVGHDFAKLILIMWTNGSQHLTPSKVEDAFRRAREYQTLAILNHGVDPIKAITAEIKAGCKDTTAVRHKYWPLLEKSKTKISKIADELGLGLLYGYTTSKTYSALSESGRALAAACKGKSQLDLLARGTKHREIMELHQCMKLRGQGVALLRIALKNVKAPTADVTGRLFSFLAKILAIRKEGTKGLYKVYLQWVKDGETSQQINEWNDSIEVFECSWHSSQEEQNHMLAEAGKVNEHDYAAEGSPAPELESCSANAGDVLDLQQPPASVLPENVIFSTML